MKSQFRSAVALDYPDNDDRAPTIAIKGEYTHADTIVGYARRFGVPVIERPELARALLELSTGEEIPEDMFEAVAHVLNEISNEISRTTIR